jgi:hypothetical protein
MSQSRRDELASLHRAKRPPARADKWLGAEMVSFFKNSVQKRQGKLGKIAECWSGLVPELLNEHCALEGYSRGTLTVIVDSSAHLYELKQLLLAGLERQLLLACGSTGLRKIMLKPGRWYDADAEGTRKVRFNK